MQTVTVTLGGREFQLRPLNIKKARAWREALRAPFNTVLHTLDVLTGAEKVEINNYAALKDLLQPAVELVLNSTDTLLDLLFDYSPDLRAEQAWIEENATDEDAITALAEVVKLAYPFGSLLKVFRPGLPSMATRKNSVEPNGM